LLLHFNLLPLQLITRLTAHRVFRQKQTMTPYLPPFNLGWGDASLTKLFHSMSHSSSL